MAMVLAVDDEVTAPLARVVAGVVPSLIERLRSPHPRRVYRVPCADGRPLLHRALALPGGNQLQAARLLRVNRNTLRKRCLELGFAPSAVRVAAPDGELRRCCARHAKQQRAAAQSHALSSRYEGQG